MFLLINHGRDASNQDHIEEGCRHVSFPVMLHLAPYAFCREIRYECQFATVIAQLGLPDENVGHYVRFLRVFSQRIRFADTEIKAVNESAALTNNFPKNRRFNSSCNHPARRLNELNARLHESTAPQSHTHFSVTFIMIDQ
jgi:hypothetical protein